MATGPLVNWRSIEIDATYMSQAAAANKRITHEFVLLERREKNNKLLELLGVDIEKHKATNASQFSA